jgi:phosphoserine phosphatase
MPMTCRTVLHHPQPSPRDLALVAAAIPGELVAADGYFLVEHNKTLDQGEINGLRQQVEFDINPLPCGFDPNGVKLIVSDMDSTLITIECIDELADCLGFKPQVAAITEAAMRGELDFAGALRQRVRLLEGLPVSALQQVYDDRLRFSPGAEALMSAARARGIKTAVVSGGFTFFTERVKVQLELDFALANQLAERDGRLTGEVEGEICGPERKREFLLDLCERLGLAPGQAIAIGDGANDLLMLGAAGLGVAYRAKPKVQAEAGAVINHGGLGNVCHLFGSRA